MRPCTQHTHSSSHRTPLQPAPPAAWPSAAPCRRQGTAAACPAPPEPCAGRPNGMHQRARPAPAVRVCDVLCCVACCVLVLTGMRMSASRGWGVRRCWARCVAARASTVVQRRSGGLHAQGFEQPTTSSSGAPARRRRCRPCARSFRSCGCTCLLRLAAGSAPRSVEHDAEAADGGGGQNGSLQQRKHQRVRHKLLLMQAHVQPQQQTTRTATEGGRTGTHTHKTHTCTSEMSRPRAATSVATSTPCGAALNLRPQRRRGGGGDVCEGNGRNAAATQLQHGGAIATASRGQAHSVQQAHLSRALRRCRCCCCACSATAGRPSSCSSAASRRTADTALTNTSARPGWRASR
jgi:hypothetical protein